MRAGSRGVVLAVGLVTGAVAAQPILEEPGKTAATNPCPEGFWPTQVMVERFLDRVADDMVDDYGFDDEQLMATRQLLRERIPRFLAENRHELQPLINEFIEAQLSDEPPTPEQMAAWAARALPLTAKFQQSVSEISDAMRTYLTEDQVITLESNLAAFTTGMGLMTSKLNQWSQGGFDPRTEWMGTVAERRRRQREEKQRIRQEMEAAKAATLEAALREEGGSGPGGGTAPPTPGSAPRAPGADRASSVASETAQDEWDQYVDAFIRRYRLTDEQRQEAQRKLGDMKQRRDEYLRRKADEIEAARKLVATADSPEARQRAQQDLDRLNQPVHRMFRQLQERLDTIPTRRQRQEAAKTGAGDAATRPAGSGQGAARPAGRP